MQETHSPYDGCLYDHNCLTQNIPVESNFFYVVECNCHHQKEWGVGKIDKDGFLIRELAFKHLIDNEIQLSNSGKPLDFHDSTVTIRSYIPSDLSQCLALENTVLCSIERCNPSPVHLGEKTLLGRLDNRIQSVDSDELRQILDFDISKEMRSNKKALILGTSHMELIGKDSKVITDHMRLRPSTRPAIVAGGFIHFNSETGHFEGYNGNKWVRLDND